MDKTTKKIGIILVFIILVPYLFYSAYEITNLNENERVIEGIYTNQLNAILYSINQYSEDIITSWSNKLDYQYPDSSERKKFFNENPSLEALFSADTSLQNISFSYANDSSKINKQVIPGILKVQQKEISKLISFTGEGYTKLQPLVQNKIDKGMVIFIPQGKSSPMIGGIIFNREEFIRRMLARKIQAIAGDEFTIYVSRNRDNVLIFSNEQGARSKPAGQSKPLWLLPEYSLGISLKGETIESLASDRLYTNLLLIILLNVILLFGIWLIFRNIKKEIQLARIKSDFVSNVSHELRTPLALVNMFAETLEMGRVRTEEKKQEYYSIITQEIARLSRIVNKILSFSKMEAGKRTYSFSPNDLNEIVIKIFATYKFHLQNNGFKSDLDLEETPLPVNADAEAVGEALINLIDNAIKYTQDNKYIKIRSGREDGSVFVEVQDKGIGISPENQKKIFEKFFRVQSSLIHNTKGTGLGLSIVKHIMDAHKGEIILESIPWAGSTFKLKFPLSPTI